MKACAAHEHDVNSDPRVAGAKRVTAPRTVPGAGLGVRSAANLLALQRLGGNAAVCALLNQDRTPHTAAGTGGALVQRTPAEASNMQAFGQYWGAHVYRVSGPGAAAVKAQIAAQLQQAGVRVQGPPFLVGEPLLYFGAAAYTYADIAAWAATQPNAAQELLSWMNGPTELQSLDIRLQALAWITHFAEVARWMTQTPEQLRFWLQEIVAGRATWNQFNTYVPASLTYAQDVGQDYVR